MQIIKNNQIVEDHWQHIADDPIPEQGCITVSFGRWKCEKDSLLARDGELGLRICPDDPVAELTEDLQHFQLIGLEFPVFTDGRLFSVATMLRHHYDYRGEIRALGGFIRDQIFFLGRVGVNSFEIKDSTDIEGALSMLDDFSVGYQNSAGNMRRASC